MKVVHVVTALDRSGVYGGPATVAIDQLSALRDLGHDVSIVAGWLGSDPAPREFAGIPAVMSDVRAVPGAPRFPSLWGLKLFTRMRREIQSADMVHIHLARDLIPLASAFACGSGTPYVVQTHGMIQPDSRTSVAAADAIAVRRTLQRARAVLSLDEYEDVRLREVLASVRPVRMRNGVPIPQSVVSLREGNPAVDVLFLARLHPIKRVMIFAEAMLSIAPEFPNATFSIAGPDQGDLAPLRRFLADHPHGHRIRYEGSVGPEQVSTRLSKAALYVLPSQQERFPMTVLESMAAGTPVVIAEGNGLARELGAAGVAAVTAGGVADLALVTRELLQSDVERRSLAVRGRAYAESNFSIGSVAQQLLRIYTGALQAFAH